jgi:predicted NAD/FAD-binding protein
LAAAWLLSRRHIVWLFERDSRIGGHTHTHAVETSQGTQNIDTGFIVHNDRTYPNFVRLMQQLGVERQASDMSFGVSGFAAGRSGRVEYSSRGLRGFFAQRSNLLRPIHYKLFAEITRFNRVSTEFITRPQSAAAVELTLGEYLAQHNFGHQMAELYLYPMASAVWSTSLDEIRSFPALTLLRFFHNHGFLTINGHPQWYVLKGGSSSYIAPITEPYRDRIATNARIQCVSQAGGRPTLHFERGHAEQAERFDEVVFAIANWSRAVRARRIPNHCQPNPAAYR